MEMKMPVHVMKRGGSPEEASWRARVTGNPLRDAFDPKIMTHAGMSASLVPDEELAVRIEEIADTVRGRRTVAYINVPYCETRCLYCLFYIKPYRNAEESRAFTDLLIRELELWNKRNVQTGRPLEAVYFGGGTPTALEASDIVRLIRAVKKNLPLANDCEITFEGRLSNFGPDRMEACMEGGTNRFSLGVQTFDTKIRQAVGRRSTKEELVRQLEPLYREGKASRGAGLRNAGPDVRGKHPRDGGLSLEASLDQPLGPRDARTEFLQLLREGPHGLPRLRPRCRRHGVGLRLHGEPECGRVEGVCRGGRKAGCHDYRPRPLLE